ncbi:hypothetical protein D3C77_215830 [compost metagenome]
MGQTVMDHRQDSRVAQQHFIDAACCRVAMEGRQHVSVEHTAQLRQRGSEVLDQTQCRGVDVGRIALAVTGDIAQFQTRLGKQGSQGRIEGMADVEIFAFLAQVHRPQAHGKQRPAQLLKDVAHGFARRQLAPPLLTTAATIAAAPFVTGATQAGNNALQLPMPCLRVFAHGYVSCRGGDNGMRRPPDRRSLYGKCWGEKK